MKIKLNNKTAPAGLAEFALVSLAYQASDWTADGYKQNSGARHHPALSPYSQLHDLGHDPL